MDLTEIPCQLDGSLCSAIVVRSYVRPIEGLVRDRIEIPCHLDRGISNGIARDLMIGIEGWAGLSGGSVGGLDWDQLRFLVVSVVVD